MSKRTKVLECHQSFLKYFKVPRTFEGMNPDNISELNTELLKNRFRARYRVRHVLESSCQLSKGYIWLREGIGGVLYLWKSNYDSSG